MQSPVQLRRELRFHCEGITTGSTSSRAQHMLVRFARALDLPWEVFVTVKSRRHKDSKPHRRRRGAAPGRLCSFTIVSSEHSGGTTQGDNGLRGEQYKGQTETSHGCLKLVKDFRDHPAKKRVVEPPQVRISCLRSFWCESGVWHAICTHRFRRYHCGTNSTRKNRHKVNFKTARDSFGKIVHWITVIKVIHSMMVLQVVGRGWTRQFNVKGGGGMKMMWERVRMREKERERE